MKKLSILSYMAMATLFSVSICSCSSEDDFPNEKTPTVIENAANTPTVCQMKLVGGLKDYADQVRKGAATRANGGDWNIGDKVYLQFKDSTSVVTGKAVYSANGWTVNYYGILKTNETLKCEAYYFEGATEDDNDNLDLTIHSAIYQDLDATYLLTDSVLTVSANLTPRVGRVRFTGTPKDSIWLTGLITHTKYDFNNNRFVTSTAVKCDTVMNTGSTDYIYASFADTTKMAIGLLTTEDAFTRYCKSEMLNSGVSGYMAVPSRESRNQWANGLVLTANGVEFTMIAVPGYSGGHYCIAETETTLELYYNVIQSTTTSSSQKPITSIWYSEAIAFVDNLSSLLGISFGMPNEGQWVFAAQGGNRTKGYTYSGSNTIGDVAWYSGNASDKQVVKQKLPNELGIYDMSGNVSEFIAKSYSGSSKYYYCGGNYSSSSTYCTYTGSNSYDSYGKTIGFRFIMPY
jgi:hypothetical protein